MRHNRAGSNSDELAAQRAEIDKIKKIVHDRNDASRRLKEGIYKSERARKAKEMLEKKLGENVGAGPSFSVNAINPSIDSSFGSFRKAVLSSVQGKVQRGQNAVDVLGVVLDIKYALTTENRWSYFPKLVRAVRSSLRPGEQVQVFTTPDVPSNSVLVLPLDASVVRRKQDNPNIAGGLPYVQSPPDAFVVAYEATRKISIGFCEVPAERVERDYRALSDKLSRDFPNLPR